MLGRWKGSHHRVWNATFFILGAQLFGVSWRSRTQVQRSLLPTGAGAASTAGTLVILQEIPVNMKLLEWVFHIPRSTVTLTIPTIIVYFNVIVQSYLNKYLAQKDLNSSDTSPVEAADTIHPIQICAMVIPNENPGIRKMLKNKTQIYHIIKRKHLYILQSEDSLTTWNGFHSKIHLWLS